MKTKLYLIYVYLLLIWGGNVYGDTCPTLEELKQWDGKSDIRDWKLAKNKLPNTPVDEWKFYNAWIYIYPESKDPGKCHYSMDMKGTQLSFNNIAVTFPNCKFDVEIPHNKKHPGYHCKTSVEGCAYTCQ
jgi:hypothetical protein